MTSTTQGNNLEHSSYFDLIDLIEKQNAVIITQSEVIAKLVNERAEQENFISNYMKENT